MSPMKANLIQIKPWDETIDRSVIIELYNLFVRVFYKINFPISFYGINLNVKKNLFLLKSKYNKREVNL